MLTDTERSHAERCKKEGCKKAYENFKKKPRDAKAVIALKQTVARCMKDERDKPKGRGFGKGPFGKGPFGH